MLEWACVRFEAAYCGRFVVCVLLLWCLLVFRFAVLLCFGCWFECSCSVVLLYWFRRLCCDVRLLLA